MHDEVITPEAFKSGLTQLEGVPLTITLDGKKRTIGLIEAARISEDRGAVFVTAKITDEEVAGIFGAAQDKIEAVVGTVTGRIDISKPNLSTVSA